MDPIETLRQLDEAMARGDRSDVCEYTYALIGWLERGGFMPYLDPKKDDWRGVLTKSQFVHYLKDLRAVASMA